MNSRMQGAGALLAFATLMASANSLADESGVVVSWSTGVEISSGTYGGTEDIEDLYLPIIARVDLDRLSFELTVPYLSSKAPVGTTGIGVGDDPVPGSGPIATESGVGDVIAAFTLYDVFNSVRHDLALDLTGRIKFGTADESKGLGTGEQDFTARADLFKFFDRITLLGSAGYKFRGDPPDLELENVLLGSVGGVYALTADSRVGLVYDYRESALASGDHVSELSAFLSRRLNDSWQIQLYGFKGFGDSAADWGAGVLLKIG